MPSSAAPKAATLRQSARKPKAAPDWQQLDQQLCFSLYAASLAMTKLYKPLLEPLKLTYPQYLALLALWERDALGVGELGERLGLDSGTLTPLLKRMQIAGLLQRDRAPDDERRVIIKLTPAGRAMKREARTIPTQLAAATRCSHDEMQDLTQRLQVLRRQLQASLDGVVGPAH